jgi:hypothetical protein
MAAFAKSWRPRELAAAAATNGECRKHSRLFFERMNPAIGLFDKQIKPPEKDGQ